MNENMGKIKIAINGFGRIGRMFFRLSHLCDDIEVVVINDISQINILSHLLKYDSVHGQFNAKVSYRKDHLLVDDRSIFVINESEVSKIDWKSFDIDVVIEATGKIKKKKDLEKHLYSGAKKVILTSPSHSDDIKTIVLGVNDMILSDSDKIVSNASCTTNSAAPLIKIINDNWSIESVYVTTIHSFTTDQNLHDSDHIDFRRARSAMSSIIPTTTGAAKALTKIFPDLHNKIGGCGIRVPVLNGSLTDITFIVKEDACIEQVNDIFKYTENQYLTFTDKPLVSVDIIGNPYSSIVDLELTSVVGKMIKVVAWYDNESGYSNRLIDLIRKIT